MSEHVALRLPMHEQLSLGLSLASRPLFGRISWGWVGRAPLSLIIAVRVAQLAGKRDLRRFQRVSRT